MKNIKWQSILNFLGVDHRKKNNVAKLLFKLLAPANGFNAARKTFNVFFNKRATTFTDNGSFFAAAMRARTCLKPPTRVV
jgi:hypothetical protein